MARSPRAEQDWRVSRALLQQVRADRPVGAGDAALSISHTRGHALVGAAPAGWRIGVDVEGIRARDVRSLARWCCSDEERAALDRCDDEASRLRAFYLLWTLKEAFIKAANLAFPADMRSVGLGPASGVPGRAADSADIGDPARWRLRTPPGCWRAYAAILDDAWLASAVWRGTEDAGAAASPESAAPRWGGGPGVALPRVAVLGFWR